MFKKITKAQSTLEYAVLIFVIVAGLLAMQIYMKRASEGKLRESSDRVGDQFELNKTAIYSNSTHSAKNVQVTKFGGESQTTLSGSGASLGETSTSYSNETVSP